LHGSGGDEPGELIARWSGLCKSNHLILIAPEATDVLKWSPTDSEFVMKCLETVAKRYTLDKSRIVAHGYQAGGAMAYLLTFQHRDVFSAVASIDAPLPGTGQVAENEPGKRLAVFAGVSTKARFAARIENSLTTLREAEYPVTVKQLGEEPRYLQPDELSELVRWIDALDRL
jgi:poly(3-hydroxybutyrate) depolymerase